MNVCVIFPQKIAPLFEKIGFFHFFLYSFLVVWMQFARSIDELYSQFGCSLLVVWMQFACRCFVVEEMTREISVGKTLIFLSRILIQEHQNYEQTTSKLRANYIQTTKMYIQTTRKVHPCYKQCTSKLRGRRTVNWIFLSLGAYFFYIKHLFSKPKL